MLFAYVCICLHVCGEGLGSDKQKTKQKNKFSSTLFEQRQIWTLLLQSSSCSCQTCHDPLLTSLDFVASCCILLPVVDSRSGWDDVGDGTQATPVQKYQQQHTENMSSIKAT
jgi:hypothetical protein